MAVDKSNGPSRGTIYVVYAAQENGNGKAVIQIRSSNNFGISWTNAQTISIPDGRQNWFPWIVTDNLLGFVYVTYYSLDEPTGFNTNTYLAFSNDGGASFSNQRVSDVNHVTAPIAEFTGGYCGDYIGITAHNGLVYPSWTDNRNNQWQVYVSPDQIYAITGPTLVCTTGTFTINDNTLPPGATVNWSSSNTQALTIDPATGAATRVGNYNGTVAISATVNGGCGATPVTPVNVYLGAGVSSISFSNWLVYNINATCYHVQGRYNVVPGATKYDIYIDNVFLMTNTPNTVTDFDGPAGTCNGYHSVRVDATLSCGGTLSGSGTYYVSSSQCSTGSCRITTAPMKSTVTIYPNPASTTLTVQLTDSLSTNGHSHNSDQPYELFIMDRFSRKVFSIQSSEDVLEIPVGNLPSDIYYLNLIYREAVLQKQFMLKR